MQASGQNEAINGNHGLNEAGEDGDWPTPEIGTHLWPKGEKPAEVNGGSDEQAEYGCRSELTAIGMRVVHRLSNYSA